jgi:hypothetical protein
MFFMKKTAANNAIPSLRPRFPRGPFLKFMLFVLILFYWLLAIPFKLPALLAFPVEVFAFGAFSAATALWLLEGLEYFATFRPVPYPDSLLTLLLALPLSTFIAKFLVMVFFQFFAGALSRPGIVFAATLCSALCLSGDARFVFRIFRTPAENLLSHV